MVLANGRLTNANNTYQADLYRALKGGANNFGVVTRFDLATFQQGNLSATSIANDIEQREAVFDAFTAIANATDFDVYTSLVTGLLYNSTSKSWVLTNSAVYTKPVLQPTVFARLESVPSISKNSKLTSLAALADEEATPPLCVSLALASAWLNLIPF